VQIEKKRGIIEEGSNAENEERASWGMLVRNQ